MDDTRQTMTLESNVQELAVMSQDVWVRVSRGGHS